MDWGAFGHSRYRSGSEPVVDWQCDLHGSSSRLRRFGRGEGSGCREGIGSRLGVRRTLAILSVSEVSFEVRQPLLGGGGLVPVQRFRFASDERGDRVVAGRVDAGDPSCPRERSPPELDVCELVGSSAGVGPMMLLEVVEETFGRGHRSHGPRSPHAGKGPGSRALARRVGWVDRARSVVRRVRSGRGAARLPA